MLAANFSYGQARLQLTKISSGIVIFSSGAVNYLGKNNHVKPAVKRKTAD
jgi:hypothetical protein